MSSKRPQLAREIILAIGDNMRQGLEPLLTRVLAPSLYQVYLHPDDFDRLRVIFREIEAEAKAHLDRELQALDRQARPAHARLRERLPQRVRAPGSQRKAPAFFPFIPRPVNGRRPFLTGEECQPLIRT
jgi:hypothetical protein